MIKVDVGVGSIGGCVAGGSSGGKKLKEEIGVVGPTWGWRDTEVNDL